MAIGLNIFIIGWTDVLSGFISGSKCAFDRRCERFSREGREAGRTTTRRVLAYKGEINKYCWSKQTNIYLHIKVKQTNIVQANIHQTNKQKFFCEKLTNEYFSVINYYLGCHNVHFRILTLQSKRSQRSLQQIQLHGEQTFSNFQVNFCFNEH